MADVKQAVQDRFGKVAAEYRSSQVHAAGEDLAKIAELIAQVPAPVVLDVGCGAGHTAIVAAAHSQRVIALDLTENMLLQVQALAEERGVTNLETRLGDAENLPFEDASFDVVVSRYSAHHWPHPEQAVAEIKRVLKSGGRFILSDVVSYDDPTADSYLQTIEVLRDPSHVRDHSISQWLGMFAAEDLAAEIAYTWQIDLAFVPWVTRIATPDAHIVAIKSLFDTAPDEVRHALKLTDEYQISLSCALFAATK